jgi:Uma2 family endonuclease
MIDTVFERPRTLPEAILDWLPDQGYWSDEDYLMLSKRTNRLVELTDGFIEELPVPTDKHQAIADFLFSLLKIFVGRAGRVRYAPLRLRIRPRKFREPDILLLLDARDPRRSDKFWSGADLVVEVVSPDKPERDRVEKRLDYAEGGIPEYWIVDPAAETITVLRLEGNAYAEHGIFARGETATSVLLPGFAVSVDETLDAD